MSNQHPLHQRLDSGEVIVLDGAIGTELQRLGAPMHQEAWCAVALDSHPELVRAVHSSYVDAGADVITANTYATTRMALERAGLADRMLDWNTQAVHMARAAASQGNKDVFVAGSVSTFGNFDHYDDESISPWFREQAEILAESGADLLLLETLAATTSTIKTALRAIRHVELPIWVAISCLQDRESNEMLLGIEESQKEGGHHKRHEPLGSAIDEIMSLGGSALLLMHSDLKATAPGMEVVSQHYDGPKGAYPNAGYWKRPDWSFVDQVDPGTFLAEAMKWRASGAQIVGGCCGLGPAHIRALHDQFR